MYSLYMSNTGHATETKTMTTIEPKIFPRADLGPRHHHGRSIIVSTTDKLTVQTGIRATGLMPCDDWDQAEYRWPMALHDIACNVRVTGRTVQHHSGAGWVRAEITFVGDDEPDSVCKGWARVY